MIEITSASQHASLVRSSAILVTDFYAPWCGPCRQIHPQVEKLEQEFPQVVFCRVNVDDENLEDLALAEGVTAMPTFTFHASGQRLDNSTVRAANVEALRNVVENLARPIPPDPSFMQGGSGNTAVRANTSQGGPPDGARQFGRAKAKNATAAAPLQGSASANAPAARQVPAPKSRKFQRVMPEANPAAAAPPPAPSGNLVRVVQSMDEYQDIVLSHSGLIVVDFNASWCGPCRQIAPMVETLAHTYANRAVLILSIDVDVMSELAGQLGVTSVPTFMIGLGAQELETFQGADSAYLEERIKHWLQQVAQ